MLSSIVEDIKMQFRNGNMLTRIILINVFAFAVLRIIVAFTGHVNVGASMNSHPILDWLMFPSAFGEILRKPWTLISHMFLHFGFWHIIWNMLLLYWFARIVGDFLGDYRILPLYILGGLAGAMVFLIADHLLPIGTEGHARALGASAAVMSFIFAAATLSPDYEMRLILLGNVKIKYIAAFVLFLDIIGSSGMNWGGHFGHMGGALTGFLFIHYLRQGIDITEPLQKLFSFDSSLFEASKPERSPIKVVYKRTEDKSSDNTSNTDTQAKIDAILEKIKDQGMDQLTEDEKAFLDSLSKEK